MADSDPSLEHQVPSTPPEASSRGRRALLVAVVLTLLAVWIARSFILPIVSGFIIATAVWPLFARCRTRTGGKHDSLLAFGFTLLIAFFLLIPLAMIAANLGTEAPKAAQWAQSVSRHGLPVPEWMSHVPLVGGQAASLWQTYLADPARLHNLAGSLDASIISSQAAALVSGAAQIAGFFIIVLVALFHALSEGKRLGHRTYEVAGLEFGNRGRRIVDHITEAIRGVVNGTLLVAVGEGALIGAGYLILGAPEPILLGVLTAVFALLPLGAWAVFIVVTVLLAAQGHTMAAGALFGWGTVVMLIGDNLVQPRMIGGAARLPFIWALVGILGGADAFGLVGLFLGPVIISTVPVLWRELMDNHTRRHRRQA